MAACTVAVATPAIAGGHRGAGVPWCQFLLWPLVLPRLLAHVSPKRESLFLEEESVTQPKA